MRRLAALDSGVPVWCLARMFGSLLFRARRNLPDFPGRQKLLAQIDRWWGPFIVTTRDDVRLRAFAASFMDAMFLDANPDAGSDREVMAAEVARLAPGDIFVDVGANIGLYSILASRRVGQTGRVLAFEPSPREFARLLENLTLNDAMSVTPFSVALGGAPGLMDLHIAPTHTGLNTLQISDSAAHAFRGARVHSVPVLTFDDAIAPLLAGRTVKLLKIDVEGAEMDVLIGMKAALAEGLFARIVIEVTPDFLRAFGRTKGELYDLLAGFGYRPQFERDAPQYDQVFARDCEAERR